MKKVINRKTYNTETATEITKYWNGLSYTDFGYFYETLYRTKKGNWFLHGEGGPLTKYSRNVGNMKTGGDDIIPINENQVIQWLEQYNKTTELEKYFRDELEEA